MNKKINMSKLLRILGILILFLNIVTTFGSADDRQVTINAGKGTTISIDNVYQGVMDFYGMKYIYLPVSTTHTLKCTRDKFQDWTSTFTVGSGTNVYCSMFSLYGKVPTPIPTNTPTPYIIPKITPTPTPIPANTPTPYIIPRIIPTPTTVSSKYIEINSQPSGANVYSGSTVIGTTPFNYNVLYSQKITFKLPGYTDKVTYIEPLTRSPFKLYLTKSFT